MHWGVPPNPHHKRHHHHHHHHHHRLLIVIVTLHHLPSADASDDCQIADCAACTIRHCFNSGPSPSPPPLRRPPGTNMQIEWRPKSAGKWHPFQWEAILHCLTAEGHRAVPSSVSRNGDCLHGRLTGRADLIRLFQKTLFRQLDPVTGDDVRFLYTLLNTPPCER